MDVKRVPYIRDSRHTIYYTGNNQHTSDNIRNIVDKITRVDVKDKILQHEAYIKVQHGYNLNEGISPLGRTQYTFSLASQN